MTGNPRPNLFVVGAMKAATSSLHAALARHPDVFMADFKEPAYFLGPTDGSSPPALSDRYRNDLGCYLTLFADGASAKYRGESTTDYTKRPRYTGVAERIAAFEPDARIIYLLRDPVERTISHYWWAVEKEGETRQILQALEEDEFFLQVSHYAWQLEPYWRVFDRARILVVSTERFSRLGDRVLWEILTWLGVRTDVALPPPLPPQNVTPAEVRQVRSKVIERLRHSPLGDAVTRVVPLRIRAAARATVERQVIRDAVPLGEVKAFLRRIQRPQVEELSDMLGRRFNEWTALYGGD